MTRTVTSFVKVFVEESRRTLRKPSEQGSETTTLETQPTYGARSENHSVSMLHWDMEHARDCAALLAFFVYF